MTDDLSALAWVQEELRKTLDTVHKSLRRYLREVNAVTGSDIDDVEPAILRQARHQLHQGVGVLELVNLPEGAMILRSAEQLVQRYVAKPQRLDVTGVEAVERASFALLDYLGRKLGGKVVHPVGLFPQWRALLELNSAERVHPADLWAHDWQWHEVPAVMAVPPHRADAGMMSAFEKALLGLVRQSPLAAAALSRDCVSLGAAAATPEEATLWRLAAAYFQAWGLELFTPDMFLKRTASRVMAQLRSCVKGENEFSERLAQDLLFYCARAWPASAAQAPLLTAVHTAYGLLPMPVVDYNEPMYGRRDPTLVQQALKRVNAAKEAWNGAASGDTQRMSALIETFTLVGDSISRLYEDGGQLARALVAAAALTVRSARAPSPELGMEVATSLLYLEAALDEGDFDHPEHISHAQRLAERIELVAAGQHSQPLEPWMEDLYRRVSDRQTLGSVVQELRVSLLEVERQIDQFFRNPTDNSLLGAVPGLLGSMRGVLSVLGIDAGIHALQRMREDVDHLLRDHHTDHGDATNTAFQRLAANLGALGFLIDMLNVQPLVAKSLFHFDPTQGVLSPVMGRSAVSADVISRAEAIAEAVTHDDIALDDVATELGALERNDQVHALPALTEQVHAAQDALHQEPHSPGNEHAVRARVQQAMHDFVATATAPVGLDPLGPPLTTRPQSLGTVDTPAFQPTGLEDDTEMREIFLEESREVVASARDALQALSGDAGNLNLLTQIRRAFHTLKGSSRMVGLSAFGEAAWACEQLYNHWLAEQIPASVDLRVFTGDVLAYFAGWNDALAERTADAFLPDPVMAGAEALRHAGELMRVALPGAVAPTAHPLVPTADVVEEADGMVDLEVPIEDHPRPVMEPLQATRPMDLDLPLHLSPAARPASQPVDPAHGNANAGSLLIDLPLDFSEHDRQALPATLVSPPTPAKPVPPAVAPPLTELPVAAFAPTMPAPIVPAVPAAPVTPVTPTLTDLPVDPNVVDLPLDDLWLDAAGMPVGDVERIEVGFAEHGEENPSWRLPLQTHTTTGPLAPMGGLTEADLVLPSQVLPEIEPITLSQGEAPPPPPPLPPETTTDAPGSADVIDLDDFRAQVTAEVLRAAQPERGSDDDQVKVIGSLRLQIPLFNIYLNEADEVSRRLGSELTVWAMELPRPIGEDAVVLAHTLAGNSATVGFTDLAQLARSLEHALTQLRALQAIEPVDPSEAELFVTVSDDIRRLLHQFAAGFLQPVSPTVSERLEAWSRAAQQRLDAHAWHGSGLSVIDDPDWPDDEPVAVEPAPVPVPEPEASLVEPDPVTPVVPLTSTAESLADLAIDEPEAVDVPIDLPVAEIADFDALDDMADLVDVPVDWPVEIEPAAPEALLTVTPQPEPQEPPELSEAPEPTLLPELPELPLQPSESPQFPVIKPLADHGPDTGHDSEHDAGHGFDADIDHTDQVDEELFPIFIEEAQELLPLLESQIESWQQEPSHPGASTACMRTLHTFKGSARLAGAMRLGEMAHRFESAIEALLAGGASVNAAGFAMLGQRTDALIAAFEGLCTRLADAPPTSTAPSWTGGLNAVSPEVLAAMKSGTAVMTRDGLMPMHLTEPVDKRPVAPPPPVREAVTLAPDAAGTIDWTSFLARSNPLAAVPAERVAPNPQPVRVRAALLDRLVNLAGEVSITRSRLESEIGQIRGSLGDLTDNLERLHRQLHDVTLQADTQLETRREAARAAAQEFDPLELDRYTRLQELTRMMAESVNDVATVRGALQRTLQTAEDELAVQARLTRELQGDLLRTRMVEFESLSERLYRVVRMAAKETGKQVRFDIVGGSIEVDRGVLDRMTAAFEHLLRNCVTHGIEPPEQRQAAAKDPTGSIIISLEQEGNEVSVEIRDDGAGLDLTRIRERAVEMGLIAADARMQDKELSNLIFAPGLSTATVLSEVAGRGVGMDVVKSDVQAMGGRIEIRTNAGRGTRFKLVLPLTTVVTQVVILRAGAQSIAVPSNLVELVQRTAAEQIEGAYHDGHYHYGGLQLPFYWLGALLDSTSRSLETSGRTLPIVIVRSAQQRVALHVDEVLGSHEVVVKNLGPQLSRVPGLAGMTLLASGTVSLIYNPVALSAVYGDAAHALMQGRQAPHGDGADHPAADRTRAAPLVLVVDDSLTVRRITKRLLEREGYRVTLAKDGLEALDALNGERPVAVLSDIEMPRMDGFDLLRNIRGDAALAGLPVIMITSRIAQKHRDIAIELGASHYLGKPYSEDELLRLIGSFASPQPGTPA